MIRIMIISRRRYEHRLEALPRKFKRKLHFSLELSCKLSSIWKSFHSAIVKEFVYEVFVDHFTPCNFYGFAFRIFTALQYNKFKNKIRRSWDSTRTAEILSVGSNLLAVYTFYVSTLANNSETNRSAISRHNIPILPHYFYSESWKKAEEERKRRLF